MTWEFAEYPPFPNRVTVPQVPVQMVNTDRSHSNAAHASSCKSEPQYSVSLALPDKCAVLIVHTGEYVPMLKFHGPSPVTSRDTHVGSTELTHGPNLHQKDHVWPPFIFRPYRTGLFSDLLKVTHFWWLKLGHYH